MRLNDNFTQRVVVYAHEHRWHKTPVPGVLRMPLDRIGGEIARATSLVRFDPNTTFTAHDHAGGEEFLVLEGSFHDADGDYPAGTYVRNPAGTSHAPKAGPEGASLFVKLQQFDQEDQSRIRIDTRAAPWARGLVDGLSVLSLHAFETEHVALVRWAQHTRLTPHRHWGGEEIFVLEGVFRDEHGDYPAGTWIRSPHLSMHTPWSGAEGALIYVKTGHLGEQPPRQNDNPSP